MLLAPFRDGLFTEETNSLYSYYFSTSLRFFITKSLMLLICCSLQSPELPLGQAPQFHSTAHFPDHSVQGVSGTLEPGPSLPGWAPGCSDDQGSVSPPHRHQMDTTSLGAWAARSSLPCQAHPELGQYLLTSWQGKDNGGHIFSSESGKKDPLANLYLIYMMSIRL